MQPIAFIDFSTKMHLQSFDSISTKKNPNIFQFPGKKDQSHNVEEMTKHILFLLSAGGIEPAVFPAKKVCP